MPAGERYAFGPFELDCRSRTLVRDGQALPLSRGQVNLLHALVARPGQLLSRDQLIAAAWSDVAVTDNSLEQAISTLRRTIGPSFIETVPRRGYRFAAEVTHLAHRESDDQLEELLAPHRAWLEGRAALETLEASQVSHAREVFERVVEAVPAHAPGQVGLANACALAFEMTRTDASPDTASLGLASRHAREACRLDPQSGEAWATLGFVLDRCGQRADALAACRRAIALEPDNWRHHLRLAYAGWGEERLRAARRTVALLPGFPLAHWLAATVHVARQALGEAERELMAGLSAGQAVPPSTRFGSVGLHWLLGLIRLVQGDESAALEELQHELRQEASGHLYARECAANAWYAIGAIHHRASRPDKARRSYTEALTRVPLHPLARIGLAFIDGPRATGLDDPVSASDSAMPLEAAIAAAVACSLRGRTAEAAALVTRALDTLPERHSAGWTLPIEPLLGVERSPEAWAPVLTRLRQRAA